MGAAVETIRDRRNFHEDCQADAAMHVRAAKLGSFFETSCLCPGWEPRSLALVRASLPCWRADDIAVIVRHRSAHLNKPIAVQRRPAGDRRYRRVKRRHPEVRATSASLEG